MQSLGPEDPSHMGDYRLIGRLGEGGMGQVYLARSNRGRTVALKLILPELAKQPEFRERFRHEVEAARSIGGEWTAPVLDADLEAQTPWVATGYVAGPSLHEVVSTTHGPLPEHSVLALANGLSYALQDIHTAGLIHRDLKPSNVMVTIDGPRIIDFGIARAAEANGTAMTRTGMVVGSPGFMSPEQCRGETVTAASDVFCLGSVLALAATGNSPFGAADSAMHVLMLRIIQDEKDLSGLPARLQEIISAALAPLPADRPTVADLLERTSDFDTWQQARSGSQTGDASVEPWLPASLIAGLGRSAVGLLDSEEPEPTAPPQTPSPQAAPTAVSTAPGTPPPGTPPPPVPTPSPYGPPGTPPPGAAHQAPTQMASTGFGAPPPAKQSGGSRRTWIVAAALGAVLLGGGAVAVVLATGSDDESSTEAGDSQDDSAGDDADDSGGRGTGLDDVDDEDRPDEDDDESNGGGEDPDGGGDDPSGSDEDEALSDESDGRGGTTGTFEEGETAVYNSGVEITVGEAEPFEPSRYASGHSEGNTAYRVSVSVTNSGEEPADVSVRFNARAGDTGTSADQISDIEADLEYSLSGNLVPERSMAGNFAFSVPADAEFLDLEYETFGLYADTAIWTIELN